MAASGCATCHADVNKGRSVLTSAWSMVGGSMSRWGPHVSGTMTRTGGSHMSVWVKKKKRKKDFRVAEFKLAGQLGSAQKPSARLGRSARFLALVWAGFYWSTGQRNGLL